MNYNFSEFSEKKKNILLASGAVVLCLGMAATVFFGLQAIGPKKTHSPPLTSSETAPKSKDQPVSEADTHFRSGDEALKAGDTEKGIAELSKAQELYEQEGNVMKVEEIKDQISLAQYAVKTQNDSQTSEQPEDKGKTSKNP